MYDIKLKILITSINKSYYTVKQAKKYEIIQKKECFFAATLIKVKIINRQWKTFLLMIVSLLLHLDYFFFFLTVQQNIYFQLL